MTPRYASQFGLPKETTFPFFSGRLPGRRARHELTEHALRPRHLQLCEVAAGRRGGVPHAGAGQGEAEGALPLQARGPDTTLVISHSKRMAVNAAANRALAPEETQVIHIDLGCYESVQPKLRKTNSPQSMVWPGLRRRKDTQGGLCGRGGSGAGRSKAGQRHAAEELRPQLQVGVARKAHAHPLDPVVLEVAGLPAPPRPPCAPARPDGSSSMVR